MGRTVVSIAESDVWIVGGGGWLYGAGEAKTFAAVSLSDTVHAEAAVIGHDFRASVDLSL